MHQLVALSTTEGENFFLFAEFNRNIKTIKKHLILAGMHLTCSGLKSTQVNLSHRTTLLLLEKVQTMTDVHRPWIKTLLHNGERGCIHGTQHTAERSTSTIKSIQSSRTGSFRIKKLL